MCQIRVPGYCTHNPEQTVLAHLNGAGVALKHLSIHGAYSCMVCHDIVDHRQQVDDYTVDDIKLMHLQGVIRTQILMVQQGILKL